MTRNDLRALFSSANGENVLRWLLYELHVFNADIETDKERILRNFGMRLLSFIGSQDSKIGVDAFMKVVASEQESNIENMDDAI